MSNGHSSQRRYLDRAFSFNPVWSAAEVIDLRSRALKRPRLDAAVAVENTGDVQLLRTAALAQIACVQSNFWKLPLDHLKRKLEQIDIRQLPELSAVVRRLRTAAACRAEFPQLASQPWMDSKLFDAFKSAVVLPPAEAGVVRERFVARLSDRRHLKKVKAAVRKIESEFPVLYAMESDWFKTLSKYKLRSFVAEGSGASINFNIGNWGWPAWLLAFILIRAVLRMIMLAGQ